MSNQLTGAVNNGDVAVDIHALFVGTAVSKSPTPVKGKRTQDAVMGNGNTNKPQEDVEKTKKSVHEAVEYFEKYARENQFDLKFSIDSKSNDVVVQLFEKGTGKLIRQIPSEEVLKIRQRISDLLGAIYDKKM
jgi:flagellar protein FlaG